MEAALGFMAAIARRGVGAEGLGRCLKEGAEDPGRACPA